MGFAIDNLMAITLGGDSFVESSEKQKQSVVHCLVSFEHLRDSGNTIYIYFQQKA